jgi:predicted GIY-YIG superfamily endonuclease
LDVICGFNKPTGVAAVYCLKIREDFSKRIQEHQKHKELIRFTKRSDSKDFYFFNTTIKIENNCSHTIYIACVEMVVFR